MTESNQQPAGQVADGSAGRADRAAGLVRVATFHARAGQTAGLLTAADDNATAARRAPGCLSAEVCVAPADRDTVLVISRWESQAALRTFLDWHEQIAHDAVSPYTSGRPHSVHYSVVAGLS